MWYFGEIGLLLFIAGTSLACYSLQEFSYSRLEEECERCRRANRFRHILEHSQSAYLVLELFQSISLLALALLVGWRLGMQTSGASGEVPELWIIIAQGIGFGILVLMVNHLVPWVISRVGSEWTLCHGWPLITVIRQIGRPILALSQVLEDSIHRMTGRGTSEEDEATELGDEIRTVVDEGQREGVIESDAGQMIHRVIELQHDDVAAIMTPRTDMFCIDVESSLEEARQQLLESGHSRVPVIGESNDDILGLLYAKDMLKTLGSPRSGESIPVLRDLLREPVYVPVTTQIPALLELMKRKKIHIAMVLDEYGGVAGLVTMEDILEEIVGEIADEFDEHENSEQIQILSPTTVEVDARVHLDDLNERLHYDLPEDGEFDTVGGFVFSQLGRVPSVGEIVEWKQLRFTVLTADKRTINRLRIDVHPENVPANSASNSQS